MRPDGDGAGLHDPLGGGGRPSAQRAGIDEAQQDLLIVQCRAEIPTARFHASRDVTQRFMEPAGGDVMAHHVAGARLIRVPTLDGKPVGEPVGFPGRVAKDSIEPQ